MPGTPQCLETGPLRAPARGKPAHHNLRGGLLPCGDDRAELKEDPAQRLPQPANCLCLAHRSVWRQGRFAPSAGQARSPQFAGGLLPCGDDRAELKEDPARRLPQSLQTVYAWHTAVSGDRAASRPSAGQARSPQLAGGLLPCGEQACPALGCAAALMAANAVCLTHSSTRD